MIFSDKWETMGGFKQDPVTALAIGTGLQAIGSIQQGLAAKNAADFNAKIARQNADIARQQTQAELETQDRQRRLRAGSAVAAAGASGVGIGSFGDILQSSAAQEELDLLTIKSQGLLRERDFEASARLSKAEGKSALIGGFLGAGSQTLMGTSKFLQMRKEQNARN